MKKLKSLFVLLSILIVFIGCSKPMLKIGERLEPEGICPSTSLLSDSEYKNISYKYLSDVIRYIHSNWVVPNIEDMGNELETIFVIRFNKNGDIEQVIIEKESGSRSYDMYALRAITESNPLPAIPSELRTNCLDIGVRFTPTLKYTNQIEIH